MRSRTNLAGAGHRQWPREPRRQKTALTGRGDRDKADTAHSHTGLLCVRKGTRAGHWATITATREVDADVHRHSGPWNAERGAGAQIQRLAAAEHHRDATSGASSHVEAARRAQVNMGQSIVSRSRPTAKQTKWSSAPSNDLLLPLSSGHQWTDRRCCCLPTGNNLTDTQRRCQSSARSLGPTGRMQMSRSCDRLGAGHRMIRSRRIASDTIIDTQRSMIT
jgi:hypothetical protein